MLCLLAVSRKRNLAELAIVRCALAAYLEGMSDKREWETGVGKSWAESWQLTDRSFAGLTERFLATLAELPGRAILDVGCGAGELSLALARHRPDARVIGVDVSGDLIAAAKARAGDWPAADFVLADAATWDGDGFAPDLIVSRHGVMFFDDPVGAFAHLHSLSAPAARMAFTCFRSPDENPWVTGLAALIPGGMQRLDPDKPGPFAFADPHRVRLILESAGWSGVRIEPLDFAYVAGAGEDPAADAKAFFSRIGPLAPAMLALPDFERARVAEQLAGWIERHASEGLVAFNAAAWLVTARHD